MKPSAIGNAEYIKGKERRVTFSPIAHVRLYPDDGTIQNLDFIFNPFATPKVSITSPVKQDVVDVEKKEILESVRLARKTWKDVMKSRFSCFINCFDGRRGYEASGDEQTVDVKAFQAHPETNRAGRPEQNQADMTIQGPSLPNFDMRENSAKRFELLNKKFRQAGLFEQEQREHQRLIEVEEQEERARIEMEHRKMKALLDSRRSSILNY